MGVFNEVRAKLKTKYEGHQVSESSTTLMRSVVGGTYEQAHGHMALRLLRVAKHLSKGQS